MHRCCCGVEEVRVSHGMGRQTTFFFIFSFFSAEVGEEDISYFPSVFPLLSVVQCTSLLIRSSSFLISISSIRSIISFPACCSSCGSRDYATISLSGSSNEQMSLSPFFSQNVHSLDKWCRRSCASGDELLRGILITACFFPDENE